MKKEKAKYNLDCLLRILIWISVYLVIYFLMYNRVYEDFGSFSKESIVGQSVSRYMDNLKLILFITGGISIIWWICASLEKRVRFFLEKNTCFVALFFIVVLLGIMLYFEGVGNVIRDEMEQEYTYLCRWGILSGFVFNLYGLPPKNLSRVMMIKGRIGRAVIAVIALGITCFLVLQ